MKNIPKKYIGIINPYIKKIGLSTCIVYNPIEINETKTKNNKNIKIFI